METLVMLSPTMATGLSLASPKANSTALLPTDSEALCILPHPSLSTPTPAETTGYPPNLARTPVVPLLSNKLRLQLAPTLTLRISASATTC